MKKEKKNTKITKIYQNYLKWMEEYSTLLELPTVIILSHTAVITFMP